MSYLKCFGLTLLFMILLLLFVLSLLKLATLGTAGIILGFLWCIAVVSGLVCLAFNTDND